MSAANGMMRAICLVKTGGPRVLQEARVTLPQPAADEALVKVHACSINPIDLQLRRGRLPLRMPTPHILGADLAGEIVRLGADSDAWQPGERVCAAADGLGWQRNGGYAEYCALPTSQLARLPDELGYDAAVALGAAFAQAHYALLTRGKLQPGEQLVIRGAGSAVGTAAVQLAAARRARVIAVCEERFAADLRALGADIVLEDGSGDLVRQVQLATDNRGARMILHCQVALDGQQSLAMLGHGGRLLIASARSASRLQLNAQELLEKNLSLEGVQGACSAEELTTLLVAAARGKYRPSIAEILPLSQARQAHRKLEKQAPFGKVILVPDAVLAAAQKPRNWVPID